MDSMKFEQCLKKVQKPARYIGNEFNSIHKEWTPELMSVAFCFPDVYEVGMSHLGMKILYHMLNAREDTVCERVFAPWDDMEQEMRREGIPLLSLESRKPIREFDMIAFTLQYEMSYSNLVNMLDLAGVPLRAAERKRDEPFVYCGGPCAYHAEPLSDLVDFFVLGEGEEVNSEIMDVFKLWRDSGESREAYLEQIAKIQGIYVPSFYDVTYHEDGTIASFAPNRPGIPQRVKKRIIKDMDHTFIPEKLIVPFMEIVHDRIMLELFRGCIRGCRFCQAGYIYRPVRERSPERLFEVAEQCIQSTGYEEISLSSLSTSDYTRLFELTDGLLAMTVDKKINLSLPSLRVDNFSMELMEKVQKVKKSGLTFAPEAGTQRLRDVINKNVLEEDLIRTAKIAFSGGYNRIKLYFMLGLPTETEEDVLGIGKLAQKVIDAFYELPQEVRKGRSVSVTVSTAFFVPKPFTPFQWEPQNRISEMEEKARKLKDSITNKKIVYNWHSSDVSFLEEVFAKGDRRLGEVLIQAQKLGCKFDGWSDFFDYAKWQQAFADCGIDPTFYAHRRIGQDEILPWDYADIGVSKEFLKQELQRAYAGITTPSCREKCMGCGAAQFGGGVCFE
ncbi:TIGR03960 family B12-binding radical SAM protein [Ructibacterium gallinarum]|uniref:TIGR03960 family B12-binding radical SAM protein n=1 Tax=Ructibacterium gallinarum TaxID=2779355 RepID=A0A9D5M0H9_9FIRM|nr:TIGR03960 family B12-binding radical SAM protein [Ructibacterium gallinarum]MBE5040387.1 TIGR03960 family B12-binding radical SAM protein [Ructibacterium gallinarum]